MKQLFLLKLIFAILLFVSCKKDNVTSQCGCNDNEKYDYTANNKIGTLGYLDNQYQKAWFINVTNPDNSIWLSKICNTDKIQNIISSISNRDTVSVIFSGRLRNFCSDEYIGYYTGIVVPLHLIIDSIKIK